jgi:hypothetical protein
MIYTFNRNPLPVGGRIEQPSDREIQDTPGLFNATLDDALMFGGDLTRVALSAMNLRGDRKYAIVDTKIHMLMPGMWPAIPGWHTDVVPRPDGAPRLDLQNELSAPRFHLLVTGTGCLTDFVIQPTSIEVPDDLGSDLYEHITKEVKRIDPPIHEIVSCRSVEWDWWDLHRAKAAQKREWRYLIRVTETDHRPPKTDLRDVLRTQQQVYVHEAFGW